MLARLVHIFQVATLRSLNCKTYATINNTTALTIGACDVNVSVSIYNSVGKLVSYKEKIAIIRPDTSHRIDCDNLVPCNAHDGEHENLLTFHILPASISADTSYQAELPDNRSIFHKLALGKDNYLEYHLNNGTKAGVLYQSLPLNYPPFFFPGSTFIQAPKAFASKDSSSMTVIYCPDPTNTNFMNDSNVSFLLRGVDGRVLKEWDELIKPNTIAVIPTGEYLRQLDSGNYSEHYSIGCLEGFSSSAYMVPISLIYSSSRNSLALEHSLPPSYYIRGDQAKVRQWMINQRT